MLETGLVLGMTATHVGVPLADLVTWALVLALLVAPIRLDDVRRQRMAKQNSEIGGVVPLPVAARCQSDKTAAVVAVTPSATRLSAAEQWQAVSRLVSSGTERAIAVARDQKSIRRELDSLDFTIENLRRELATVMAMPVAHSAELVPVRAQRRSHAMAA